MHDFFEKKQDSRLLNDLEYYRRACQVFKVSYQRLHQWCRIQYLHYYTIQFGSFAHNPWLTGNSFFLHISFPGVYHQQAVNDELIKHAQGCIKDISGKTIKTREF